MNTKESYEVYICYLGSEIVYVGSGRIGRHEHCNSGTSHVYKLNKLHFEDVVFDVKVRYVKTKEASLEQEVELINRHLPAFNFRHTPKALSKIDSMNDYRLLKEIFYSKYPIVVGCKRSTRVSEIFRQFLKVHILFVIDGEGVVFRGKDFYRNRGLDKLNSFLSNHRIRPTVISKKFLNALKESLDEVYKRDITFKWFIGNKYENVEM